MTKTMTQILDQASQALAETQVSSEFVFDGQLLKVYRDTVRLPDGQLGTREFIRHPGAAAIVPLLDNGNVLLLKQYRYPLGKAFIEFPAGKIDAGELPLQTAQRELKEETGYEARQWHTLTTIHNAIGYADERLELFLAEGLTAGTAQPDSGEVLEVFEAPLSDLLAWIAAGIVTDVKTIIAAFFVQQRLAARG